MNKYDECFDYEYRCVNKSHRELHEILWEKMYALMLEVKDNIDPMEIKDKALTEMIHEHIIDVDDFPYLECFLCDCIKFYYGRLVCNKCPLQQSDNGCDCGNVKSKYRRLKSSNTDIEEKIKITQEIRDCFKTLTKGDC